MDDSTLRLALASPSSKKAIAWDPSCSSSLAIAASDGKLNITLASNGLGTTAEEVSALLELLDARDEFEKKFEQVVNFMDEKERLAHLYNLCTQYIQSIGSCARRWDDRLAEMENKKETEANEVIEMESQNLYFLKSMHCILHLSCFYLLSPSFSIAEAARFLRYHFAAENDDEEMDMEMLKCEQPEYYQGGGPFWSWVEKYVQRGLLEDAWALLSHHSALRRCTSSSSSNGATAPNYIGYDEDEIEETRLGFSHLYALLHSAPIPGGHTDERDIDFNVHNDGGDGSALSRSDEEEVLLKGVPTDSYKYWEAQETLPVAYSNWMTWKTAVQSACGNGLAGNLHRRIPQLVPSVLNALAGRQPPKQKNQWANLLLYKILYVRPNMNAREVCVESNATMRQIASENNGSLSGIESIMLSIMRGDAGSAIEALHIFGGGSGAALPSSITALLCDLFTHADQLIPFNDASDTPNYHLELILSAASSCQSSFATTATNSLLQKLQYKQVGIQCAVRLLRYAHHLRGIATMSNMLSSLDQTMMSDQDTDIILGLCGKYQNPLRLSHYNTEVNEDNRSRAEALVLLHDAQVDLCLSRVHQYLRNSRPGGAVYWSFKCADLERTLKRAGSDGEIVLNGTRRGSQMLSNICSVTATNLLRTVSLVIDFSANGQDAAVCAMDVYEMISADSNVKLCLDFAQEVWNAVQKEELGGNNNDGNNTALLFQHLAQDEIASSSMSLLRNTVKLTIGLMEEKDQEVADAIVECLRENEGECNSIANMSDWIYFIKFAYVILLRQEEQDICDIEVTSYQGQASFDMKGVQVLLESLSLLEVMKGNVLQSPAVSGGRSDVEPFFSLDGMRLLLGKALTRALVVDNYKRYSVKNRAKKDTRSRTRSEGIEERAQRMLSTPACVL